MRSSDLSKCLPAIRGGPQWAPRSYCNLTKGTISGKYRIPVHPLAPARAGSMAVASRVTAGETDSSEDMDGGLFDLLFANASLVMLPSGNIATARGGRVRKGTVAVVFFQSAIPTFASRRHFPDRSGYRPPQSTVNDHRDFARANEAVDAG